MAIDIQKVLSKNLRQLRASKKLTQEQCADLSGISLRYYQAIEAGKNWPSPEMVRKLSKGFRCKQTDLFKG